MSNVLYIEDSTMVGESISEMLRGEGHEVIWLSCPEEMDWPTIKWADSIVCDYDFGGKSIQNGTDVTTWLVQHASEKQIILFSGLDRPTADGVIFVRKDYLTELIDTIRKA